MAGMLLWRYLTFLNDLRNFPKMNRAWPHHVERNANSSSSFQNDFRLRSPGLSQTSNEGNGAFRCHSAPALLHRLISHGLIQKELGCIWKCLND